MHSRYFDEFSVGDSFRTRSITITEGQIVDFALTYDPQHMHLDRKKAEEGPFGGLIASGFQTLGLSFRMFYDLGLFTSSNTIGPGLDNVRWTAPVYPGDNLYAVAEVIEMRESRSKPDRGIIRWKVEMFNQKDESVMSYEPIMIVLKRPA